MDPGSSGSKGTWTHWQVGPQERLVLGCLNWAFAHDRGFQTHCSKSKDPEGIAQTALRQAGPVWCPMGAHVPTMFSDQQFQEPAGSRAWELIWCAQWKGTVGHTKFPLMVP